MARVWRFVVLFVVMASSVSCTALLGDFNSSDSTAEGGPGVPPMDGATPHEGGSNPDATMITGSDGSGGSDAPTDGPVLYTLTVASAGAGSGTIVSAPMGISCGSTCSASFLSGTTVVMA